MPRFSPTDAVEALFYRCEALVDERLELIVGEDIGPILLGGLDKSVMQSKNSYRTLSDAEVCMLPPGRRAANTIAAYVRAAS